MDKEIILKQDPELDLFSYHELLDRSYLIMTQIESFLIDHQVVEAHPELKKPLEDAMLLIGEVYKAAGTVEIEADDEE
jgi:hypothetical protein|tara:strand:- start:447 stop:680 length:234 start_codon:yes stop_codon:yes gene_type:complete